MRLRIVHGPAGRLAGTALFLLSLVFPSPWLAPAHGDGAAARADRKENRLAKSNSPYLLLHAKNPVDWYPWGPEALERAKTAGAFDPGDADLLIENFRQLRRMESILRRWSFEGETVLPDDPEALYRVAVRCGYGNAGPFMADLARWRADIRRIYESAMSRSRA